MGAVAAYVVAGAAVAASVVSGAAVGTEGETPTATFTAPPGNYDDTTQTHRSLGTPGGHLLGHYALLGSSHYLWWRQGDVGVDPGDYESELAGRTGVMATLPASAQTQAQVATASASALTAAGLSSTADGNDITVSGVSSVTGGSNTWDPDVQQGVVGQVDSRVEARNDQSNVNTLRGSEINAGNMPSGPYVITGVEVRIGATHSVQCAFGVYQGGVTGDFEDAELLGTVGATTGSGTSEWQSVPCSGVLVDPADGPVWIMYMQSSGAGWAMPFTWPAHASSDQHGFTVTGGNVTFIEGSVASSDPGDFPATLGADNGSPEIGIPPIRVLFREVGAQSDCLPTFEIGTLAGRNEGARDATYTFTASSDDPLVVTNAYAVPSGMRGLALLGGSINYFTHVSGSDYALVVATGTFAAADDMSGGDFTVVGQTSGTATGWNRVPDLTTPVALAEGSAFRLGVKYDGEPDPGPRTALAYDSDAANLFSGTQWGDAWMYSGNTTESEYAPLANTLVTEGNQTTNVDYDPSVSDPDGVWTPNGTNFTEDNNVGVFGVVRTVGFAPSSEE